MSMWKCMGCGYPQEGDACGNPRCFENPTVSQATKDKWRAEQERARTEEAERRRIAEIRARPYG